MTGKRFRFGVVACAFALPLVTTSAQAQTATTTQTTPPTPTTPTTIAQSSWRTIVESGGLLENEFIATGFYGGAYGGDVEFTKVGFGGSFDYLRKGTYGAEFLGTFTPGQDITGSVKDHVQVDNYMFNGIGALPIGGEGWLQPYVSGGVGMMRMRTELGTPPENAAQALFGTGTLDNGTQFGGNIGFGAMWFVDKVGVRGDVRYFSGIGNDNPGNAIDVNGQSIFLFPTGNLAYWVSSIGGAFRW